MSVSAGLPHRGSSYGKMSVMTRRTSGRTPRGGVPRTHTTVRLSPNLKQQICDRAQQMGITLSDALAYFCAVGAGLEVPPDVMAEVKAGAIEGPSRKLPNRHRLREFDADVSRSSNQDRLMEA